MKQQWLGVLATIVFSAVAFFGSPGARAEADADSGPSYGAELEGFDYAYPPNRFDFVSQGDTLAHDVSRRLSYRAQR